MIIQHDNRKMILSVDGYEFPEHERNDKNNEFDYDANWLNVKITYIDENGEQVYTDSCLMTSELSELIDCIKKIISGKELLYISDFMEPYLKIAIAQADDKILVGIEYVYDTNDGVWKSHKISEAVTVEKAIQIADELQKYYEKFPLR